MKKSYARHSGYFIRRVAELIATGGSIERAQSLALEIIITEVHLNLAIREGLLSERERVEAVELLREIEEAKYALYRACRAGLLSTSAKG
uniref:Uncharacterized protein n=1 Tax=Thermofilum pendens TaxID=2269 RepID=A0A7C3SL90_THEPE